MNKVNNSKAHKKESRKEAIARIAGENRAHFEKLDAKNGDNNSPAPIKHQRRADETLPASYHQLVCPDCFETCSVALESIGADVSCPHCSKVFKAAYQQPQSSPPISKAPPQQISQGVNVTAAQFAALENSIKTTLNSVVIQNMRLVHVGGTRFKAHLTIMTAQGTEQSVADVNFDGDSVVWQIVGNDGKRNESKAALFTACFQFVLGLILSPIIAYFISKYVGGEFVHLCMLCFVFAIIGFFWSLMNMSKTTTT